jgi:dTDP-4-amino-4,6-dideoxygalactose transaminase
LRDHGRSSDGDVVAWGYNARLDNVQAAVLDYKLKFYDQAIARRRALAQIYDDRLSSIGQIKLPPGPNAHPDHFDIYQNYEIEAEQRDELRAYLDSRGVKTLIQWGGRMIHQFKKLGLNDDVPLTEALSKSYLLLPLNTSLLDDDLHYICDVITAYYSGKTK